MIYYAAIENDNTFVKYFGAPTTCQSLLGAGDMAMGKTEKAPVPMGLIFKSESWTVSRGTNEVMSDGGDADS